MQRRYLEYTLTKLVDPSTEVTVQVIATSAPVPGAVPITISDRVNSNEIEFTKDSQVVCRISLSAFDNECWLLFNTAKIGLS